MFGGNHKVDGRPSTKVDIHETNSGRKYSVKNVTKNHTQVALLSASKFIKHFKLKGTESEAFINMFFGYYNKECESIVEDKHPELPLSDAEKRQNRVYSPNISKEIKRAFVKFMNDNRQEIFNIIVRRGFDGDDVHTIIWHTKGESMIRMIALENLEKEVQHLKAVLQYQMRNKKK